MTAENSKKERGDEIKQEMNISWQLARFLVDATSLS